MDELAAMARGVRTGIAEQLSSDGILPLGELDVSADDGGEGSRGKWIRSGAWILAAHPPHLPADWFVLDGGLRPGIGIAADPLGEHRRDLLPMFVLSVQVRRALSVEVLPASFSSARDLGSSPGLVQVSDHPARGNCSSRDIDGVDDLCLEQQRSVGWQLGLRIELAGLVYGRHCAKTRPRERSSVKSQ